MKLDVDKYKTARGVANSLYRWLKKWGENHGYETDWLFLTRKEYRDSQDYNRILTSYEICWETGPYEWASSICAGCGIVAWDEEVNPNGVSHETDPEMIKLWDHPNVCAEPIYSFSLSIYNN